MKHYQDIPQPPRSRLLGHVPQWIGVHNAETVLQRLGRYAAKCGPVTRLSLGPVRVVFVADADIAAEVLSDERANYKGASYILTRAALDNVLLMNGAEWEQARKAYRLALRNVDVLGAAKRHTERLALDGEISLEHEVMNLVRGIVADFVAGVEFPESLEADRAHVQYELAALGIDLQCRPWSYFSPQRWIRLKRSVRSVRTIFDAAVSERLSAPTDRPDVLSGFLALARAGEYPKHALKEGVVNYFFAAHEVVASTTMWMLWLLATHPQVQDRLRASLDGSPIERNEYLGCVAKESLRLYPGYSLFGRTTREDMPVGGYLVPEGTFLIFSPFVTHRLEAYWPNAASFDPDRFAGRGLGTPPPQAKDAYFPFGSGARGCLASHLAMPLVKTIVATLLQKVELVARPGHVPDIRYWGTALARNGLPVQASPLAQQSTSAARHLS